MEPQGQFQLGPHSEMRSLYSLHPPSSPFGERSKCHGGGLGRSDRETIVAHAGDSAPASCIRRPNPALCTDPANPVPGPARRGPVEVSALARHWGSRGPGPGSPASRPLLALLLLLLLLPAGAWYKHVASPRYHTVGRAAGLLMGLRRSPYLWRRALRPAAGPLAWDNPAPGPAARSALLLPSRAREPWEARRELSRAGLPVRAPRSPRVSEPTREHAQRLRPGSWTSAESVRAFRDMLPVLPWSLQQTAFPEPVRLHDCPENVLDPRCPSA